MIAETVYTDYFLCGGKYRAELSVNSRIETQLFTLSSTAEKHEG
jgi:hypothetical protein